jgi:hypothetical protein
MAEVDKLKAQLSPNGAAGGPAGGVAASPQARKSDGSACSGTAARSSNRGRISAAASRLEAGAGQPPWTMPCAAPLAAVDGCTNVTNQNRRRGHGRALLLGRRNGRRAAKTDLLGKFDRPVVEGRTSQAVYDGGLQSHGPPSHHRAETGVAEAAFRVKISQHGLLGRAAGN